MHGSEEGHACRRRYQPRVFVGSSPAWDCNVLDAWGLRVIWMHGEGCHEGIVQTAGHWGQEIHGWGKYPHLWLGVDEDSIEIEHQDIADGQDGGGASWSASDVSAGDESDFQRVPSIWMRASSHHQSLVVPPEQ